MAVRGSGSYMYKIIEEKKRSGFKIYLFNIIYKINNKAKHTIYKHYY